MKSKYTLRLARLNEKKRIIDFINQNFDWKLPLVNLPEYFDFYYAPAEQLQFAVAEQGDEIVSVAGYIKASEEYGGDIWVSVWVAKKGHNGAGLELMDSLPALTGARCVSCNNIRPETCNFYRFLGWEAERIPHYYRIKSAHPQLAVPPEGYHCLPVKQDLTLTAVANDEHLEQLGLPSCSCSPKKDLWYIKRRYFHFPHRKYQVFAAIENGNLLAYIVCYVVKADWEDSEKPPINVLRIVDFIGEASLLSRLGGALDHLIDQNNAEYADCYCVGIAADIFWEAGFVERKENDGSIIPNYLNTILQKNTEYYYFTNQPDGFRMMKADGDQDRPNIPLS